MRDYLFTRLYVALAILVVRMLPLLVFVSHPRSGTADVADWGIVLAVTVVWQVLLHGVSTRCSGPDIGYTRGLFVVGAAMSTGWIYLDLVFVAVGVVSAQALAIVIASMPGAAARYSRLVRVFYRHRMEQ